MKTTKEIGDAGESLAKEELKNLGYLVLDQNYRSLFGEIDIIAKKDKTLVFVEVKVKKDNYFGSAGEMITKRKLEKIIKTAKFYLLENNYQGSWRIDGVLIDGGTTQVLENISC